MSKSIQSYWELLEPYLESFDIYEGPEHFFNSVAKVPRLSVLLYAAHMSWSEIENGGFLQLFVNSTGLIVPEAIEAFRLIEMPIASNLIAEASLSLGTPYPRERNGRQRALLVASGLSDEDLRSIFDKQPPDSYRGFAEATRPLSFRRLEDQFWEEAGNENGGLEAAATLYAQNAGQVS